MALNLLKDKGVPIDQQKFTWKDLVQKPISKLNDDAFTRVRVILMNGIESESVRFSHSCARMNKELQVPLAKIRRIEQHQLTIVNWLNPADQSPLETTEKNIAIAAEYVKELDAKTGGKLITFLNSGIGNSSALTLLVFGQAQRLAYRNGVEL